MNPFKSIKNTAKKVWNMENTDREEEAVEEALEDLAGLLSPEQKLLDWLDDDD